MKPILGVALWALLSETASGCGAHLLARAAKEQNHDDCTTRTPPPPSKSFAIRNVRVFDGTAFGTRRNVVVSGGKITYVGCCHLPELDDDVEMVDGLGKFLIPGLVDGHVHAQSCGALRNLTAYGVTTGLNMACSNYTTCAQLKNQAGVADFKTAGLLAVGTGSPHARFFHLPAEQTVGPGADLATIVEHVFTNGSDFYKVVAEEKGPTQEQQNELVRLVRSRSKATYTHASTLEGFAQAITSKCDGIQHIPASGVLADAQVETMLAQGQFVTPTMGVFQFAFKNPSLGPLLGISAADKYENVQANVKALRRRGVPVAVGSDAFGSIGGVDLQFGKTLHCELQYLAAVGYGNGEVLHAATEGTARLYGLTDRGSIAVGLRADMVLLNSDPVKDITNTLDISKVWAAGVEVSDILSAKGQSC